MGLNTTQPALSRSAGEGARTFMNAPDALTEHGFRRISEFEAARSAWPRGQQPALARAAAEKFRARFKPAGVVQGVQSIDLVAAGYPAGFAFHRQYDFRRRES